MKLQFDSSQNYQLQAVKSVVNLFEGQPLAKSDFEMTFAMEGASIALTQKGVGNNLILREAQILENLQKVQQENRLRFQNADNAAEVAEWQDENGNTFHFSIALAKTTYKKEVEQEGQKVEKEYWFPNFTVEMETGTGKTYTFLRTVYELNKVYGFKKFVIVVPSVAIREGTIKNLQITHEHFQDLYESPPINYVMYDSKNITALRNFAMANTIQILVINIDSFTSDTNVINSKRETGVKPIEYIQATNPFVIIDEPQNFETETRKQAISNLSPLCTLRYSATHKNLYNLVYSLNPVQAYDLGLVKQIEVNGITSEDNCNIAFIEFKGVQASKKSLKAKLDIYKNEEKNVVKKKTVTVEITEDLFVLSNERHTYKDNYILNSIDAEMGMISFANGVEMRIGDTQSNLNDEVMKIQIRHTIRHHFKKVKKMKDKGIKVLSLFFIDKVVNYRQYDNEGNASNGKFATWFEDIFQEY